MKLFMKKHYVMWYIKMVMVFISLSSCKTAIKQDALFAQEIDFEVVLEQSNSNIYEKDIREIHSYESLQELYTTIYSTQSPKKEAPFIDFDSKTIVFLNLGQQNTSGYSIRVQSVQKKDNKLVVNYETISPKPYDMVSSVLTTPFQLVMLHGKAETIVFEEFFSEN